MESFFKTVGFLFCLAAVITIIVLVIQWVWGVYEDLTDLKSSRERIWDRIAEIETKIVALENDKAIEKAE